MLKQSFIRSVKQPDSVQQVVEREWSGASWREDGEMVVTVHVVSFMEEEHVLECNTWHGTSLGKTSLKNFPMGLLGFSTYVSSLIALFHTIFQGYYK